MSLSFRSSLPSEGDKPECKPSAVCEDCDWVLGNPGPQGTQGKKKNSQLNLVWGY